MNIDTAIYMREAERRYDVKQAGRRLLAKPDRVSLYGVFDGDFEKYKACVISNFGECCDDTNGSVSGGAG